VIQHLRYDPSTFQLAVTFKTGAQHLYFYVFPMTVDQFFQAPSKGKFFGEAIKGKFPSVKVIHKTVGPKHHNSLRGPIKHERKVERTSKQRVAA
jgi:KTSC domain